LFSNSSLSIAITGEIKADLAIIGGKLINVVSEEIYDADVAISGSRILAIGDIHEYIAANTVNIDVHGKFLSPGLIDGHQHFELSKLSPSMFAKLVVPHGTTSIITGLDQIAGVAGLEGIRECLNEAEMTGMKFFFGGPVKLPYTIPPSTIGKEFGPQQHKISSKWPECFGVWETVADFVLSGDPKALEAMKIARDQRQIIAGSGAFLRGKKLSAYVRAGIRCDHECFSVDETLEKLRNGLWILIREGSGVYLLNDLIRIVTDVKVGTRRLALATDGALASEVLQNGHLDNLIRRIIKSGVSPLNAIQMASINCAEAFRVDELVGSISPGRYADIVILENLENFHINKVIVNGKIMSEDGSVLTELSIPKRSEALLDSFHVSPPTAADLTFESNLNSTKVQVMCMNVKRDNLFAKARRDVILKVENGKVLSDTSQDVLCAAVVERHRGTGNKGLGFISGYNLKSGAIASSVSPDDNNIVAVGTNPSELAYAINYIIEKKGGQIVVNKRQVIAFLHLPIAGILSDFEPDIVSEADMKLDQAAKDLGSDLESPFTALMFLSIVAYPDLGLTDRGLVDCKKHEFVNPIIGPA
jgi:adenine deaminase